MQAYIFPIIVAGFICFLLASFLTVPFIIYQYRKYGFFSFWKSFLIFSFVFYGLSAYLLVIFPIPAHLNNCAQVDPDTVLVQKHPFQFIKDIKHQAAFQWNAPSSYVHLLITPAFYVRFFNVLLLFPLGVYLRFFKKEKKKWYYAAIIGFAVSLFFEITQRTAIYGVFSCAYRVFDVDDLIANTAGAILGFFLAPMFLALIPSKETLEEQRHLYHSQRSSSFGAQVVEVLLNIMAAKIAASFISGILQNVWGMPHENVVFAITFFVMMVVIPAIWKGRTIGGILIRMKLSPQKGSLFANLNRRFWIVYIPFLFSALVRLLGEKMTYGNVFMSLFALGLLLLQALLWIIIVGNILIRWMKKDNQPFFNQYARIEAVRTARNKKKKSNDLPS